MNFSLNLSAHLGSLRALRTETCTGSASFKAKTGCRGPDHISCAILVTMFIRSMFNKTCWPVGLLYFLSSHHTYIPCFCPSSIFRTKRANYIILLYRYSLSIINLIQQWYWVKKATVGEH